jgi:hypothetical protein
VSIPSHATHSADLFPTRTTDLGLYELEFATTWISGFVSYHFKDQNFVAGLRLSNDYYYFVKSDFTKAIDFVIPINCCCYFYFHQANSTNWLALNSLMVVWLTVTTATIGKFKTQHCSTMFELLEVQKLTLVCFNFIIN